MNSEPLSVRIKRSPRTTARIISLTIQRAIWRKRRLQMPLSRETVHNKALNGRELKKILLQDSEKLFAANGLLNDYLGYGRIGYEIRLTLHLDNFSRTIDV